MPFPLASCRNWLFNYPFLSHIVSASYSSDFWEAFSFLCWKNFVPLFVITTNYTFLILLLSFLQKNSTFYSHKLNIKSFKAVQKKCVISKKRKSHRRGDIAILTIPQPKLRTVKPVINGSWEVKEAKVKDWMDKCLCKEFVKTFPKKEKRRQADRRIIIMELKITLNPIP